MIIHDYSVYICIFHLFAEILLVFCMSHIANRENKLRPMAQAPP